MYNLCGHGDKIMCLSEVTDVGIEHLVSGVPFAFRERELIPVRPSSTPIKLHAKIIVHVKVNVVIWLQLRPNLYDSMRILIRLVVAVL
jgi:hypothetical protein